MTSLPFNTITIPLAWLAGGLFVGLIIEVSVLAWLNRVAQRTKWAGDEIIILGLRGNIIYLFTLAGVFGLLLNLNLTQHVEDIGKKALYILAILVLVRIVTKIAGGFVQRAMGKDGKLPSSSIFSNLTKGFILVLGLLFILQSLGIAITPLLTALGVGGLAVALALQDTLANLFAGLQVLAAKKIKPGDYIQLESGQEGYVEDVTWRSTSIRMLQGNLTLVPNAKLANTIVTNFDLPNLDLAVLVQMGVSYESDLQKVERVTTEVAEETMRQTKGGVPDFEPFIRFNQFADSSINFTVILRAATFVDQYLIKHEFIKRLHGRYKQEGIEIPFPMRTVQLRTPASG